MHASNTQAAAKTMEHLTYFVFISMGNLTLAHRDAYLNHLKTGIKPDALAALRTAPLHIPTLFPDTVIKWAEEEIAHYENKDKLILHMISVGTTPMNAKTKGRIIGQTTGQISQHGKTSVKDNTGRTRDNLLTFHPDQPRASSPINDNYCVKVLQTGLLARSKQLTPGKTMNTVSLKTLVNSVVVNPVLTAPGLLQKKDTSPCMSGCYQKCKLKCVTDVLCKTCNKYPTCCLKSTCRGQTSKLLANLAGSGCQSKSSSKPQRGLHPLLSDLAELDKVTDHCKLLCQFSQESLPLGGITSAYGQKCSRASSK